MDVEITIRICPATWGRFIHYADKQKVSVSSLIETLMKFYIENNLKITDLKYSEDREQINKKQINIDLKDLEAIKAQIEIIDIERLKQTEELEILTKK